MFLAVLPFDVFVIALKTESADHRQRGDLDKGGVEHTPGVLTQVAPPYETERWTVVLSDTGERRLGAVAIIEQAQADVPGGVVEGVIGLPDLGIPGVEFARTPEAILRIDTEGAVVLVVFLEVG